jgi:HPt (histidine-containing phosphotransfer) domain-containing protein
MKTKIAQKGGGTMQPEDIDKQWQQLEARAAELGLSLEEFIGQRLMELQESQPEVFAELKQNLATAGLRAVHAIRKASAKLPHLQATAQKENNITLLAATHDIRDNLDAMLDYCAALVLAGDESQTPS